MAPSLRYKEICPACFSSNGFSVPMKLDGDVFQCTKDHMHRYRKNKDGFLERV